MPSAPSTLPASSSPAASQRDIVLTGLNATMMAACYKNDIEEQRAIYDNFIKDMDMVTLINIAKEHPDDFRANIQNFIFNKYQPIAAEKMKLKKGALSSAPPKAGAPTKEISDMEEKTPVSASTSKQPAPPVSNTLAPPDADHPAKIDADIAATPPKRKPSQKERRRLNKGL